VKEIEVEGVGLKFLKVLALILRMRERMSEKIIRQHQTKGTSGTRVASS